MSIETYYVNDGVELHSEFRVRSTGALTDPTTVQLKVHDPDGVTNTYTYAGGTVTKDATGLFSKTITATKAGVWSYMWKGTGTVAKSEEGTFTVKQSAYGLD